MRTSIMTEKLARRGAPIRTEYAVDFLSQVLVRDVMITDVHTLAGEDTIETVRDRLTSELPGASHQGYPVISASGQLLGVVTRRDLLDQRHDPGTLVGDLVKRPTVITNEDNTLREAADHMVREGVGRLPVIARATGELVGIISRSDLLAAHEPRLTATEVVGTPLWTSPFRS